MSDNDNLKSGLVFLLDVDNTLLNNDRAKADIQAGLSRILGEQGAARFWQLYEQVRHQFDVVDYPETLRRFAHDWQDKRAAHEAADLVSNLPYADYVYPNTMASIKHLSGMGEVAILSDGDSVYQPGKIAAAGLTAAVGGPQDVLIYTHKEECFDDVMQRLPGEHYVLVDDKERILALAKAVMGGKLTTVWVKQGHYAADPKQYQEPRPDITLDNIGDLRGLGKEAFGG